MSSAKKKKKDKKNKKDREGPKAEPTPLLKVEGPTDAVELSFAWEGGDAVLASLTDNGDPVDFGRSQGVGEAGLVLRWLARRVCACLGRLWHSCVERSTPRVRSRRARKEPSPYMWRCTP